MQKRSCVFSITLSSSQSAHAALGVRHAQIKVWMPFSILGPSIVGVEPCVLLALIVINITVRQQYQNVVGSESARILSCPTEERFKIHELQCMLEVLEVLEVPIPCMHVPFLSNLPSHGGLGMVLTSCSLSTCSCDAMRCDTTQKGVHAAQGDTESS